MDKKMGYLSDKEESDDVPVQERGPSFWNDVLKFAVIAALVVLPIRMYIIQPFIVSGSSMFPTFESGDYLIVDEVSYRFEEPQRGDVIVFRYPLDPSKFFIKRIVGLPGETVEIKNSQVLIEKTPSAQKVVLDEPYIDVKTSSIDPVKLKETEYFVLGDNREASSDSRVWGVLDQKFIIGRALIRLLPISQAEAFPGKVEQ